MQFNLDLSALSALNVVRPAALDTLTYKDVAASLATRLRIAREFLRDRLAVKAQMLEVCRQNPIFRGIWDEVERLTAEVPKLEEELKSAVRKLHATTVFAGLGRVKFSDPQKRSVDPAKALKRFPDLETRCPEVLRRTVEVDLKAWESAIASGALPKEARDLIDSTPATSAGRIELEYNEP